MIGMEAALLVQLKAGGFKVETSVHRSSSLDWKKDPNWTEPNCKRPDHRLWLHKF